MLFVKRLILGNSGGIVKIMRVNDHSTQPNNLVEVKLNGHTMKLLPDTGSQGNIMPRAVAVKKGFTIKKEDHTVSFQGYDGGAIQSTNEYVEIVVECGQIKQEVSFWIVDKAAVTILGIKGLGLNEKLSIYLLNLILSQNNSYNEILNINYCFKTVINVGDKEAYLHASAVPEEVWYVKDDDIDEYLVQVEAVLHEIHGKNSPLQLSINAVHKPTKLELDLLELYDDVITEGDCTIETILSRNIQHRIDLIDGARPVVMKPYKIPLALQSKVQDKVDDYLDKGFIRKSTSEYASPALAVPKKDDIRLCIDYRKLNKQTVKNPSPMPLIDELLNKIGSASVFSTFDLTSGYHQIPIAEQDIYKTAFVTHNGKYEWLVMPFGLVNAPATFMNYMNDLFRHLQFVSVYLDDILIFSDNEDQHLQHVCQVLDILKAHGLIAKKEKCFLFRESVDYLGYTLSKKKIEPNNKKVKAISLIPIPDTVKDAQRFMGMVNYYRKFIPRCSTISAPIYGFIANQYKWNEECTQAFQKLKDHLTSSPILRPFDPTLDYVLTTDASKVGIGAVLEAVDENGKFLGAVEFFSKSLGKSEKNYSAGDLEMLAIISALKHFSHQLKHGKPFYVRTDHSPLTIFNKDNKEPTPRIARWLDFLGDFKCEFIYMKGSSNVVADCLSRNITPEQINHLTEVLDTRTFITEYKHSPLLTLIYYKIDKIQLKCKWTKLEHDEYKKLEKRWENPKDKLSTFFTIDKTGLIRKQKKVYVPKRYRFRVLDIFHTHILYGGHFGVRKTVLKIEENYTWKNLALDVANYIRSCENCQRGKFKRITAGPLMPLPIPERPWLDISLDFVSGFQRAQDFERVLVVVDRFSKQAHFLKVSKNLDVSEFIFKLWSRIFCYHGLPLSIVSDQDILIMAPEFQEFCTSQGIKSITSSGGHAQTDGQSERTIETLTQILRCYLQEHPDWPEYLPVVEMAYNSTVHESTGHTPYEIVYGEKIVIPANTIPGELNIKSDKGFIKIKKRKEIWDEVREKLEGNRAKMMKYDKNVLETYQPGDFVLLDRRGYWSGGPFQKTRDVYLGPFKVVKAVNQNAYELDIYHTEKKRRVYNVKYLKRYHNSYNNIYKGPKTDAEIIQNIETIKNVVGRDKQYYYCIFANTDPRISIPVPKYLIVHGSKFIRDMVARYVADAEKASKNSPDKNA